MGLEIDVWYVDAMTDFCDTLPRSFDNSTKAIQAALVYSKPEILIAGTPFSCYGALAKQMINNSIATFNELHSGTKHNKFLDWFIKNIESESPHCIESLQNTAKDALFQLMRYAAPKELYSQSTWETMYHGLEDYFSDTTDSATINPLSALLLASYRLATVEEFLSDAVVDRRVFENTTGHLI